MMNTRPERIVNLISAILVLVVGFYAIIFLPLQISPAYRIFIGALLVIYFLVRLKYYFRKVRESEKEEL
jgi:hypothetical protein